MMDFPIFIFQPFVFALPFSSTLSSPFTCLHVTYFNEESFFFEATKCNLSVTYFGYLVPFRTIHIPIPWQLEMLLDKNDDGRLSFGCLVHFNTYNTNSFMCKQTNYLVRSQKSVYWILNENEKKNSARR